MLDLTKKLDLLDSNLKLLISKLDTCQNENKLLKSEIATLKQRLEVKEDNDHSAKVKSDHNLDHAKRELSSKIDDYVAEIDACIDYLKSE